ncbi:MAG: hypothetical protein NVS4B8_09360 [Herpetosiphon sp.]
MFDGVLRLTDELLGDRAVRFLELQKLRGSASLRGRHSFSITDAGIEVYPRMESVALRHKVDAPLEERNLSTGVPGLDNMLQGGLPAASTTLLLGPSGSGKTLLGLHFLTAGLQKGEAGVYFGFSEPPTALLRKADRIGLDLSSAVAGDAIEIVWHLPFEEHLDCLGQQLFAALDRRPVRRLFIDGLDGFRTAARPPDRLKRFLGSLYRSMQARSITIVSSLEVPNLFPQDGSAPLAGISELSDNFVILRQVEVRAQLHRLISAPKLRDIASNLTTREFVITGEGINVALTATSAERILGGRIDPVGE